MNYLKIKKQIAGAFVACALMAVVFSSCHRGHGCPANQNMDLYEIEQEAEPRC